MAKWKLIYEANNKISNPNVLRVGEALVIPQLPALRVPTGFRAAPGTAAEPYTNTGWAKEVIHEKTGIEMVFIPAGEFMMGSPSNESGRGSDEGPQHRVRLTKPFYLGKYEVTQREWRKVMGSNPSGFKGDRNPVEQVSWNDCREFVDKAGLRLPTEAEWEYACRAGSSTRFSFDDNSYAWYDGNSEDKTHPVGQKKPNAWGLFDMHGNVWEWCADWYGNYSSGRVTDSQGPSSGSSRVLRGGSWYDFSQICRSANRSYGSPDGTNHCLGFRVARTCN
ncbi:MAG: formylglycine-generating enzyme family protein [Planctomycetes bacterium]|nr:formylglycine-generating enzyme family protein [Planctomycetota bacterium]